MVFEPKLTSRLCAREYRAIGRSKNPGGSIIVVGIICSLIEGVSVPVKIWGRKVSPPPHTPGTGSDRPGVHEVKVEEQSTAGDESSIKNRLFWGSITPCQLFMQAFIKCTYISNVTRWILATKFVSPYQCFLLKVRSVKRRRIRKCC